MENQVQYQNQYQNQDPNYYSGNNQQTVTIGNWILTYVLMAIPLVNLVMLFVWAFGSDTPKSKANWAKATLIIYAIGIGLVILFASSIIALVAGLGLGS